MIKYVFPYQLHLKRNGRITVLPVIPVEIFSNLKEKIFRWLLIDSGAETTLLPGGDAKALGIDLKKGKETFVAGISPVFSIIGYRHIIKMKIGQNKFEIPILFVDSEETPRVLGREGIFDKFFILFDEKRKQTIFILRDKESQKKIKSILNEGIFRS